MAKIYQFPGGRGEGTRGFIPSPLEEKNEKTDQGGKEGEEMADRPEDKPEPERYLNIVEFVALLETITPVLARLSSRKRENKIRLFLEMVRTYSDQELFGWVNRSTVSQRRRYPCFFSAIIETLKERDLMPRSR
ncbi:MAG TPA: hypothetical protein VJB99_02575 [Patescibacteria group bacterium]|nr:hypothetical protein [Patescibacteria group bacterium]